MIPAVMLLVAGLLVLVPAGPAKADAEVEEKPLIVALCHGDNQSWPQNLDKEHFEDLFEETGGSQTIVDYWRDVSQGRLSIDGSRVLDVQLDILRDEIGDRDQNDFGKCKDGVDDQYSVDWDEFAGPLVIKPQTEGRTTIAIDEDDTEVKVRAEGPSVMDDWPEAPFTLVLTKTGTLWRNPEENIENVKVTDVDKDEDTGIATFTIEREQPGYRDDPSDPDYEPPPAKSWPEGTIVKDIADTYGSKNGAVVVKATSDPSVINHELGHFFGFPHSRKLSTPTNPYGDCFDIMSTVTCASHYFNVPFDYPGGSLDQWDGPGMTSAFLDQEGWIPAEDRDTFPSDSSGQETYSMRGLGLEGAGLQQVRVPVDVEIRDGVRSEYLIVELRSQQFTWDQGIPRDAFVLHLLGDDGVPYWVDDAEVGGANGMVAGDYYVFDAGTDDPSDDRCFFVNGIDEDNGTGQITVGSCPLEAELTYTGPTSFTYHTSPEVSAELELESGAAAPGGEVTFGLDWSRCWDDIDFSDQQDGTGEAICDLDIDMTPDTYDLTASWDGIEDVFAPAEDTVEVTVDKRGTILDVEQPEETTYHDPVTLRAELRETHHDDDSAPGWHPVEHREVELSIGDGSETQSCTAGTGNDGLVECEIGSVEQTPDGDVPVSAEFSGGYRYTASSDETTLEVVKRDTRLTVGAESFAADGGSVELTGTLVEAETDLDDSGTPIEGRNVTLTLGEGDDLQSCEAETDPSGEATCTIGIDQELGPQAISGTFDGDDFYLPSSDEDELTIFDWTDGGHFVIGDSSADPDATVTFWSSEWYLENTVSGGQAPDSFKGFAHEPSDPADLDTTTDWTSLGGNSTGPPDKVPEYTAMIVTDAVEQHGRDIVGSTDSIAIVHVDPGYQPDPGHSSTATVLGFLSTE